MIKIDDKSIPTRAVYSEDMLPFTTYWVQKVYYYYRNVRTGKYECISLLDGVVEYSRDSFEFLTESIDQDEMIVDLKLTVSPYTG